MLDADLERGIFAHLRANIADGDYEFDFPGEPFRPEGLDGWIEPRIVAILPTANSRKGSESKDITLVVTVYVPSDHKGGREFDLPTLVDLVRAVIDPELSAKAAQVKTKEGTVVGIVAWAPVEQTRQYSTPVSVRGSSLPGVDFATLTSTPRVSGGTCG